MGEGEGKDNNGGMYYDFVLLRKDLHSIPLHVLYIAYIQQPLSIYLSILPPHLLISSSTTHFTHFTHIKTWLSPSRRPPEFPSRIPSIHTYIYSLPLSLKLCYKENRTKPKKKKAD